MIDIKEFVKKLKLKKVKTSTPSTFITSDEDIRYGELMDGVYNPLSWILDTSGYDPRINETCKRIKNPLVNELYMSLSNDNISTALLDRAYITINNDTETISKFLTLLSQLNVEHVFEYNEDKNSISGFIYVKQLFDKHKYFLNIHASTLEDKEENVLFNRIVSMIRANMKYNIIYNRRSGLADAYVNYLKSVDGANTDIAVVGVDAWDLSLMNDDKEFSPNNIILSIAIKDSMFDNSLFETHSSTYMHVDNKNMTIFNISYADLLKIKLSASEDASEKNDNLMNNIDRVIKLVGNI